MELLYDPGIGMKLGLPWDSIANAPGSSPHSCIELKSTMWQQSREASYSIYFLDALAGDAAGGPPRLGVRVRVNVATVLIAQPELTAAARRLVQSSEESFRLYCGDRFLSALILGGEYNAGIEFTSDHAKPEQLESLSGTWTDASLFEARLKTIQAQHPAKAWEYRRDGRATVDVLRIMRAGLEFASFVLSRQAEPYLAIFSNYDGLSPAPVPAATVHQRSAR